MWSELLAKLRALALYYQTAHWQVKGSLFYQDHLLFDRLYNSVVPEIDKVGERSIGITGDRAVVNLNASLQAISDIISAVPTECPENLHFASSAIALEKDVLACLELMKAQASFGSENLLADIADNHESHLYLLQQRVLK